MISKISYLIFFIFLLPLYCFSQEAAKLNCIDVVENGDVTIWWTPPTNTNNFLRYEIYYSPTGSNFYIVGVIYDVTSNHFDHIDEPMADLGSRYYYVKTLYDDGYGVSDILQTMFLQVGVSADFDEAMLYWSPPSEPLPEGSNSMYHIYMKNQLGDWQLFDSTSIQPFKKKVNTCNSWVDFQITLSNINGCISHSNIGGNEFKDIVLPDKPIFDSVSINYINNIPHIVLGWESSLSQDVVGYILYRQQGLSFFEFDTIYGIGSTFYIDTLVPACDTIHKYAIASIDSCGNKSPGTFTSALQNIRLYDVVYNPCMLEATITFEPFIDYDADSISFELVGNSSAGAYTYEKSEIILYKENLSVSRVMDDLITVIDEDLRVGRIYDYFVREKVYKGGSYYTTSSCIKSIYAYRYEKPTYTYFANADVLPNYDVELTIDYDTLVKNSYLQIWRSDPGNEELKYLRTISVDTLNDLPFEVIDTTADGSLGYYLYGIKIMDSCNKKVLESNRLKTIGLSLIVKDKIHNLLQWNRFTGWKSGVEKYYIYRMDGNIEPTAPIDSVYWYEEEYTDDISNISSMVENLVYWVQGIERAGNDFGFKEISRSNRTTVIPESDIYFPNAFKPGGINDTFKPVFKFLGGSNYLFQIYNRWGQLIFETNDSSEGWDGTLKGSLVGQGTYIYKFQYLDIYGSSLNKQGTVTVIY